MDETLAAAYPAALARVARRLPEAACLPDAAEVPVMLVGEIGLNFLDAMRFPHAHFVNRTIARIPALLGNEGLVLGVVSARGLTHLGDNLHFDASSADQLGRRYAYRWLMSEGLLPDGTCDFALAPALLNDTKDKPWWSFFTCST
jgi:hypothetical protein